MKLSTVVRLRTLSADVGKSISDVENYSKEFVELQDQLNQMSVSSMVSSSSLQRKNGILRGMTKSHLKVNGADYVNDARRGYW